MEHKGHTSVTYTRAESFSANDVHDHVFEGEIDAAVSSQAEDTALNIMMEKYVMGMLNNFDNLPCERIHNHLKLFANGDDFSYDKSVEQLVDFLNVLVHEGKLEMSGSNYAKCKS